MISEPGIYDVPEAEYHADPVDGGSLSSSEAKLLLDSPARFRWRRDHGEEHRDTFDFGHAAHGLVLGVGRQVEVFEYDNWLTKAAKADKEASYEAGLVPLLRKEWCVVEAMAVALHEHPSAGKLLARDSGEPEQTLVWRDRESGVMLRALIDWLRVKPATGRHITCDYKTTSTSADARTFGKTAARYGYHQSAGWYLDGISTLLDVEDPAFLFIVQERRPPYLVNVVELDRYALTIGRERNRRAIDIYVECVAADSWPGYGPDVELASLPRWAELQHEEEMQIT